MKTEICLKCGAARTLFVAGGDACDRGGKHWWRPRAVSELAIDCVTCRWRLRVRGVPFVANETDVGRVRRALIAQAAGKTSTRVREWLAKHASHELTTSALEDTNTTPLAGVLLDARGKERLA